MADDSQAGRTSALIFDAHVHTNLRTSWHGQKAYGVTALGLSTPPPGKKRPQMPTWFKTWFHLPFVGIETKETERH